MAILPLGDRCQCLGTFLVFLTGEEVLLAPGRQKPRRQLPPYKARVAPPQRIICPNVSSAEADKPCSRKSNYFSTPVCHHSTVSISPEAWMTGRILLEVARVPSHAAMVPSSNSANHTLVRKVHTLPLCKGTSTTLQIATWHKIISFTCASTYFHTYLWLPQIK